MYYVLLPSLDVRTRLLAHLKEAGFHAVFHYVPLHRSPAGRRLGRASGPLAVTDDLSDRLVRLPLWIGMTSDDVAQVSAVVRRVAGEGR
jgi:dTDP-4-amino-4,6-dideoxygalactose transaminase